MKMKVRLLDNTQRRVGTAMKLFRLGNREKFEKEIKGIRLDILGSPCLGKCWYKEEKTKEQVEV